MGIKIRGNARGSDCWYRNYYGSLDPVRIAIQR
jgi:hypothetical protein